jgi:monofunctional biosynthetic peptidoglycan transglycosylase
MHTRHSIPCLTALLILTASGSTVGAQPAGAGAKDSTLILGSGAGPSREWLVVNDGVMGGISRSAMRRSTDGKQIFEGDLSLENNGGFASVRTRLTDVDLASVAGIALRVRGDGRQYQLRFRTDDRLDGIAYRAFFETRDGEWIVADLPLGAFEPSFRGIVVPGAEPLDPGSIRQLVLLIADEQEGPFRLEIDWVKAYER